MKVEVCITQVPEFGICYERFCTNMILIYFIIGRMQAVYNLTLFRELTLLIREGKELAQDENRALVDRLDMMFESKLSIECNS